MEQTDYSQRLREHQEERNRYYIETIRIAPVTYKVMVDEIDSKPNVLEIVQLIWNITKSTPKIIYLVLHFFKLMEKLKMEETDKKTTLMATIKVILGVIAMITALFGVNLGPEVQTAILTVASSGYFIFSWIQGFFTKDKKPTSSK